MSDASAALGRPWDRPIQTFPSRTSPDSMRAVLIRGENLANVTWTDAYNLKA